MEGFTSFDVSDFSADDTFAIFRGFKLTGPTVIMIYRMMAADLLRFVAIYFIFVMGFAQGESGKP